MNTYRRKVIYPFVEDLVNFNSDSRDELDIDKIDDSDLQHFAALLIEEDNRDLTSITDNTNYDTIVSSILKLLLKDNHDNRADVIENLQKHIVNFYRPEMEKLIAECVQDIKYEKRIEQRKTLIQDRINGEYREVRL